MTFKKSLRTSLYLLTIVPIVLISIFVTLVFFDTVRDMRSETLKILAVTSGEDVENDINILVSAVRNVASYRDIHDCFSSLLLSNSTDDYISSIVKKAESELSLFADSSDTYLAAAVATLEGEICLSSAGRGSSPRLNTLYLEYAGKASEKSFYIGGKNRSVLGNWNEVVPVFVYFETSEKKPLVFILEISPAFFISDV